MATTQPSPQQVGREFVRQYYTVLHEAPELLHRFYSSESTFVHGGVDRLGHVEEILKGQIEINRKIQQLSFKDCHTKIRQVDAQSTIGDAVVVQVTGELSNNGEPMRRFMQTFVLVAQTPKKFYVHNDIFRYQDEVYNDDNEDSEGESVEQVQPQSEPQSQQELQIQQNEASTNTQTNQYFDQGTSPSIPRNEHQHHNQQEDQHLTNGHTSEEETPQETSQEVQSEQIETTKEEPVEEQARVATPAPQEAVVEAPRQPLQEPQVKSSWARVTASKNQPINTVVSNVPANKPINSVVNQPPLITKPKEVSKVVETQKVSSETINGNAKPTRYNKQRDQASRDQQQQQLQQQQQQQQRQSGDNEDEKNKRYPDTQQIFVGNLQPDTNEIELKTFFSQFGNVIEVRINYNNKQQSGRRLPNYGFIVFDKVETVNELLRTSKPYLTYVNDKGVEHRLNIEEKRARNQSQQQQGGQQQQERRQYNRQNRSSSNGNARQSGGHGGSNNYKRVTSATQQNGNAPQQQKRS